MLPGRDDTNSPSQDSSGQHQEIYQMNELQVRDGKDEAHKLLAESSHEVLDDKEPYISVRNKTGINSAPPVNNIFLSRWPEIAWCVFSTALMFALAALLKAYDKKPAPEWVISLNTVVAVVSTICRASIVIPVSEGLSQLK
ncbi:Carboxylic ester hydrolase [Fusarium austroafricanum]|uniref:Carboxylic ester hydrolase n=1 Tax=Fusarium austroafricanum TaxID=2364996 RepID=A0A8H4K846_9HYPO|nr:Carboxylic ester hydrolase [Fusarium austroafricanum]